MKEHPILFSGPMVRAILDGTKTQTRRIVKQGRAIIDTIEKRGDKFAFNHGHPIKCPYGEVGTKLWVRETWCFANYDMIHRPDEYLYRADFPAASSDWKWKSSIHMPRIASRILLEITGIRCERLQDISEADAIAEGIECKEMNGRKHYYDPIETTWLNNVDDPKGAYKCLWESINGHESWEQNPFVWVVEFKRIAQ